MDVKITPFESLQIDSFAAGTENGVKREVSRLVVFRLGNQDQFRLRNQDQSETSSAEVETKNTGQLSWAITYLEPCMPPHVILRLIQREKFHPCVHLQMYIC